MKRLVLTILVGVGAFSTFELGRITNRRAIEAEYIPVYTATMGDCSTDTECEEVWARTGAKELDSRFEPVAVSQPHPEDFRRGFRFAMEQF